MNQIFKPTFLQQIKSLPALPALPALPPLPALPSLISVINLNSLNSHNSLTCLLLILLMSQPLFAGEGMVFSGLKREELPEVGALIDQLINQELSSAIADTENCDRQNPQSREKLFSKIELLLDTNTPKLTDSLYRELGIFSVNKDSTIYNGIADIASKLPACCDAPVRVGNTQFTIDKFDHFVSAGFYYFSEYEKTKKNDPQLTESQRREKLVNLGIDMENSVWGLSNTGIKSYADLAANYRGFEFYRELIDGDNPYLVCENNHWQLNKQRPFHIGNFVDDGWDEEINCSSFANKQIVAALTPRIRKLIDLQNSKGTTSTANAKEKEGVCPIEAKKCESLKAAYGEHADKILHPSCLQAIRSPLKVEPPSTLYATKDAVSLVGFLMSVDPKKAKDLYDRYKTNLPKPPPEADKAKTGGAQ